MEFYKMHGCGNDFVFFVMPHFKAGELNAGFVRRLCHRHLGIGADGVILVLPAPDRRADFRMRILNSDGSEAEMCGNGIRCLGKLVFELGLTKKKKLVIKTKKSRIPIELLIDRGSVRKISVQLPEPEKITVLPEREFKDILDFKCHRIVQVVLDNPHCIIFTDTDTRKLKIEKYGPLIEHHRLFHNGTNVEFVNITGPSALNLRVWERGAGETMACGSGACATTAAAIQTGLITTDTVTVTQPGGDLEINWQEKQGLIMTGPAAYVYSGTIK